jgi:hypothetical protein
MCSYLGITRMTAGCCFRKRLATITAAAAAGAKVCLSTLKSHTSHVSSRYLPLYSPTASLPISKILGI